jgi:hypothetical protein
MTPTKIDAQETENGLAQSLNRKNKKLMDIESAQKKQILNF